MNLTLVIVGVVICMIGLTMLGRSQMGALNLRNIGINFGSKNTQNIRVGREAGEDRKAKPDWAGLVIAAIGLLAAVVGLFKH